MEWEETTKANFEYMIAKVPVFMRDVARAAVSKKLEEFIAREGGAVVNEKSLVDAFFAATPFGFHGPMKNDMKELGIDYTQYGHDK